MRAGPDGYHYRLFRIPYQLVALMLEHDGGRHPNRAAFMREYASRIGPNIRTGSPKQFVEDLLAAGVLQELRRPGGHGRNRPALEIVKGVATYALELFTSRADLDVVYVPVGMGSGICGLITVRDLLGFKTEIVGVIAENAPAFALSLAAGRPVQTTCADIRRRAACRDPQAAAFDVIAEGATRIVLAARRRSPTPSSSTTPRRTTWPRVPGLRRSRHSCRRKTAMPENA